MSHRLIAFVFAAGLAAVFSACSNPQVNSSQPETMSDTTLTSSALQPNLLEKPELRETADLENQVFGVYLREGKATKVTHKRLLKDAFGSLEPDKKFTDELIEPGQRSKLHPKLQEMLQSGTGGSIPLIVHFQENLEMSRFPEPATDQSRDSRVNQRALKRAAEIIKGIQSKRAGDYRELSANLEQYGAKTLDQFWLLRALLVEMPLEAVEKLAAREDVQSIEPQFAGEKPPGTVATGRADMQSDPYFGLGLTGGWIGLLDSGVRRTHTLFTSPSHLSILEDMTGGNDANDDCWNHGTSTAAVITGNANQGNNYRGVTGITLDSFKVYPRNCAGLDQAAVLRGFQRAVAVLDRVIVAEMQAGGDEQSAISSAADNAFDAGAVVIAANGNNGPGDGTVNSPANAHKVIGVGAVDVDSLGQQSYQSRGPTVDRRFKPDLQAPTNAETASSASDTARRFFGGTSGATPHAAGAAALLRNWLRGTSFSIDPGQVYAQMILSGQQSYPFNNTSGSGLLKMPVNGWAWWGKTTIGQHQTIDIPLNIGAGHAIFDGALWWPERNNQHSDIDLRLIDPQGNVRASSFSIPSVFERARVSGGLMPGVWKLQLYGYNVSGSQTVYWSSDATR
jgi:serine protease AprX